MMDRLPVTPTSPRGEPPTPADLASGVARRAAIIGVVGCLFAGIVFGPLAIWKAKQAEALNKPATAGKVLGWIGLLWGIGQIILVIAMVAGVVALGNAGY